MAIRTETVAIPNGTPNLSGYLATPAGLGKFPAVVVIHEAFGLNEDITKVADRFAEEGYIALAVDLFAGRNRTVCMFRFISTMFLGDALNHDGIRDLKASLSWLEERPNVDASKLGAIGFCLGGGFAIAWACTDTRLNVIAPFYGVNPRPFEAVKRLCPVVGSYPAQDFTKGHGEKLEAELTKDNIPHDIKIYPDTHHSFFTRTRDAAETEAASDSWERIKTFFGQHIGGTA